MTTTVIVSSPTPNHQNVLVEAVDGSGSVMNSQLLTEGQSTVMYVHHGQALKISEVEKAVESMPR